MKAAEKTSKANNIAQKGGSFFHPAGNKFFSDNTSTFFPAIKPRLEISNPNDPEELEADRLAEKVMRMDEHSIHH